MSLDDIDLLDLDRFQRLEHHEMFERLRAEAPVYWHDDPMRRRASGTSSGTTTSSTVEPRHAPTFSSEIGGISILDPDEYEQGGSGIDPRGLMMLYTDPPKHTRYRLLVNKGFTPRMIGLLEQYLEHRADPHRRQHHRARLVRLRRPTSPPSCPLQAIAEIMGVPQEERSMLFDWSNRMIGVDDPEYAGDADDGATAADRAVHVRQQPRPSSARRTRATTSSPS